MSTISNGDDIIDSRQVIERLAELAGKWQEHANGEGEPLDAEERYDLDVLTRLAEQGEQLADWQYGEALIRDSYFVEHAKELADDLGAIDSDARWPANHIDWEAAAEELKMDYTSVEFDGVTYWGRS